MTPGSTRENLEKPVTDVWWGDASGLRCGRVAGRISSGGWRWKVSSEGAVWLWLNREGSGLVWGDHDRFILKPGMYAMTGGGKAGDWSCVRYPGIHALELVVISKEWLKDRLGRHMDWLHPDLGQWLRDGGRVARVSLETGTTLQRHLRRMRIESACEALDSDKMNVTEVALEVGYQSLSHFAKAFREETGESPSKWLGRERG